MKRSIFTEEALARLRSPEDLGRVVTVTRPVAWMALFTVGFMVVSIVIWGVFGVLSVSVTMVGMIQDPAGTVNVYHDTAGKIGEILVQPGDRVRKGDVVARLVLPHMMHDIVKTQRNITKSMSQSQVEENISNFNAAVNAWHSAATIVSAFDGIVTEVKVNVGDVVAVGATSICGIRQDQRREDVIAVMYVPADSGKKVEPGMTAQLVPSGTDQQEDGYLMGVVRSVSLYPVSSDSIMKTIGNPNVGTWIVRQLDDAVMEVKIDLVKDPDSPSGYLWSSSVGKHKPITVGTVCTGTIVTDREPPLSRVFKKLSQWIKNA